MLPSIRSHAQYQSCVLEQLRTHYSGGILVLLAKDWTFIEKFWLADLSNTASVLSRQYAIRGIKATDSADLFRSYLLMLQVGCTSVTAWVDELRRVPLYAIISGFFPGHTPGVGTFYDFFARLWPSASPHLTGRIKPKRKKKPVKGKKGEKAPTTTPKKVERLVRRILIRRSAIISLPTDRLMALFRECFVQVSASLGILGDVSALSIAGDGTPIRTAAYPRSQRICDCRKQGKDSCACPRLYSQPDCDIGWDSHRNCHYFGYHLYRFTASDSRYDLPLYPRLCRASRHDSVSLVVSIREFEHDDPDWTWKRVLLDAAHDAMPFYRYFVSKDILAFIDLNKRHTGIKKYKDDITLSDQGTPICQKGLAMKNNGYDVKRGRRKYRCPLMKKGGCTCDTPCSDSAYGRCVYTYTHDNPRLFPPVARNSEAWNGTYKRRTSVERSNKREKIDYKLEAGRHRSTNMWLIRIFGIMMCQHLDAWHHEIEIDLKSTFLVA
ncbi:transposase [Sulfoacidibacillus ferrooxidans]|uniref:transposase n=1 Tax=Sulfoacidibacillus ferrooxidans TaxID=2005001 RepID=UPI001F515670|nr:transposase [Sulfoacidibacillus ferrooxidans]